MNVGSIAVSTRRASLVALSASGLTALTGLVSGEAKNKHKNKNKVARKARKKCRTQRGQCIAVLTEECGDDPDCLEVLDCCEFAARCEFAQFFACLLAQEV